MKPGDVVTLKSGSPLLTVGAISGHAVHVHWFEYCDLHCAEFAADCLEKAPDRKTEASYVERRLDCLQRALDDIVCRLNGLKTQGEMIMALAEDVKAALKELDTETTAIGVNIANLAAKITNGMSDADVALVKADFNTLSERLKSLAVDPTLPVPTPSPALAALRKKS